MTLPEALAWLERRGTPKAIDAMARYGIVAERAYGVPMATLLALRKKLGTDHELSLALWESGWYEARLLAALLGDPGRVTRRQMDAWAKGFENWADGDTACFHLFDRTPFAWEEAARWATARREYTRRGGFALMACLALHDKTAPDRNFLPFLPLIEAGAKDDRNFVRKGVSWALRSIGRRSPGLHAKSLAVSRRLAAAEAPSCRWVGKDALRDLDSPKMRARIVRLSE